MSLELDMSYTTLPETLYAKSAPATAPKPAMLLTNDALAECLGIDAETLNNAQTLDLFSGQTLPQDYAPIAMAYSGHQFGHLSPQLGDGRAILIGELVSPAQERFEIHLKGSGRTPFSRRGDGKSTLRAALKEYIFSESLAALGIPTSRSLAVLTTDETVLRDAIHPGAILARVARSHIRVGTFQFARLLREPETLTALADFVIARAYAPIDDGPEKYDQFFREVIDRQASLIAKWMSVGFVHGVMNTDNMAISGETIDFGPCAFVDGFKLNQVFSSIDHHGRYAWNKQAEIGLWNLSRLAEAILPLFDPDEDIAIKKAEASLGEFMPAFINYFHREMAAKLGIVQPENSTENLITKTFTLLHEENADYTLFFCALTDVANGKDKAPLLDLFENKAPINKWFSEWFKERSKHPEQVEEITAEMPLTNPVYIPRTYLVEDALARANDGDMDLFNNLLKAIQNPFDKKPEYLDFAKPPGRDQLNIPTFCET